MNKTLIDLHLHLDGSLSVASIRKLAAMQNMELPAEDEAILERLRVNDSCTSLADYLKLFAYALSFLQTPEAVEESVYILLEELKELGLIYTEIRFAPQLHMEQGMTQDQVVGAAIRGMKRSELKANLILCCMRSADNHEVNLETIKVAAKYLNKGVCAVDLAGGEVHFPFDAFALEFNLAKELRVPSTIHAGESDGPDSVWLALSFGATRIGHGVRSIEDPELVKELAKRGTVLELCPTSNLDTHVFEKIEDYPLRQLMEAGVRVTINSDDMAVSDTDVKKELELVTRTFSLTEDEVYQLKVNAVDAAFADKETKAYLMKKLKS